MKNALEFILNSILGDNKKFSISEETTPDGINFQISVDKDSIGRVIGKEGKVIRALRNVMKIPAIKSNQKIMITLQESEE